MSARHCGRLDVHNPHEWRGFWDTYYCPGHIVTEGGHWTRCPGCGTSGTPHEVNGEECREAGVEKAISQGDR